MNPWELDATGLMIWGLVAHLIADWPLQNEWMALNKMRRRQPRDRRGDGLMTPPRMYTPSTRWWDRHLAAYVHAGIHGVLLAFVFGWVAAPLAFVHLLIDLRWPVAWWSRTIGQTQPKGYNAMAAQSDTRSLETWRHFHAPLFDIGAEVRIWNDQVFHIATIAVAALVVGGVS